MNHKKTYHFHLFSIKMILVSLKGLLLQFCIRMSNAISQQLWLFLSIMLAKIIICHINCSNCIDTDDNFSSMEALRVAYSLYIVSCLRIDSHIVQTTRSTIFYLLEYIAQESGIFYCSFI